MLHAGRGGGATVVQQRIDQRGPIGTLVGLLAKRLTHRYMEQEAQGLKVLCEAKHRRDAATT